MEISPDQEEFQIGSTLTIRVYVENLGSETINFVFPKFNADFYVAPETNPSKSLFNYSLVASQYENNLYLPPGAKKKLIEYTWKLTDSSGNYLEPGTYILTPYIPVSKNEYCIYGKRKTIRIIQKQTTIKTIKPREIPRETTFKNQILTILPIAVIASIILIALFLVIKRRKPSPAPSPPPPPPPPEKPKPEKRYCMHCGALMPVGSVVCPNCGKAPPSGVDVKTCEVCGAVIPKTAKFCSKCGSAQK